MATAAAFCRGLSLIVDLLLIPRILAIPFGMIGLSASNTTVDSLGQPAGRTASIPGIVLSVICTLSTLSLLFLWASGTLDPFGL